MISEKGLSGGGFVRPCHMEAYIVIVVVVVVVFYSSNKSTKTQANETFHYTILVN